MESPDLTNKLKALLILAAGSLLAIFLGSQIGNANYRALFVGAVIIVIAGVALFSGRFFWVLTIGSSFLGGTFPIFGGKFNTFQILMAIGVAKFLIGDVVLRRTRLKIGNRIDALMITGFMGILTWHAIHDRFGMQFLGSSVWGGHNYVNVYVGLAAFFVVRSIPTTSKIWTKLPYVVLAMTAFDLIIAITTTVFPASIYVIYPFYSAVSSSSLEEIVTGTTLDLTGRIGAFGNFGFVLILIVLASAPLTRLIAPGNLLKLLGLVIGFVATLFSGFRSAVINGLIGFLVAGIRDLRYAAIALLPLFAAVLFALSAINSQFFHLPKQIQRGLAFLPGDWDADMAQSAAASNDFRRRVWTIWRTDYFPVQPWFGRGFGFRSEWTKRSIYAYPGAADYRQMVETGNIHNGLFATVDTFGIVGTIFFVVWNVRLFLRTFRVSFRKNRPANTALRFLALYLAVWILSYWFGALNVGLFLPLEFALASVFLRLQEVTVLDFARSEPAPSSLEPDARRKMATA
jgi:O-antigen ligase